MEKLPQLSRCSTGLTACQALQERAAKDNLQQAMFESLLKPPWRRTQEFPFQKNTQISATYEGEISQMSGYFSRFIRQLCMI